MKREQFMLVSRPVGLPSSENFRIESSELDKLKNDEIMLKPWYISVDPYMRGRMNDVKSYAAPFQIDQPIVGRIVAKVIESKSKAFSEGDIVIGNLPWSTYCIEKAEKLRKIESGSVPPSYHLGILGMPGLTAYFGIMDIGKPQGGETVVISGAAGAVGIVAGQIAKIQGSIVAGITGSDDKCKMLKEEFGFDEAINYKSTTKLRKDLGGLCKSGIDVYFDNVGGEITDAVIANLNFHSRIALCGQISHYNSSRVPTGPVILPALLTKSVLLQGYIVGNYSNRFGEAYSSLTEWVNAGKLKYKETIVKGFNKLPEAFLGLFNGINKGKMLVEIE